MKRPPSSAAAEPGKGSQRPKTASVERGIQAFQAQRWDEARRIMQRVLQQRPAEPNALHILGLIAARDGRFDLAERRLRRCTEVAPESADAHANLGNALAALGRAQEAEASYRKALELAPAHARAYYNLANCLQSQGRLEDAEHAFRQALELAPESVGTRINLGNLLRQRGQLDEAAALFQALLAARPELHHLWLNLGNIERQRGDLASAEQAYKRLLAQDPTNPRANLAMAVLALDQRDLATAGQYHERAAASAQAPTVELWTVRANLLQLRGQPDQAADAARRALEAGETRPELRLQLIRLLTAGGGQVDALAILEDMLHQQGNAVPGLLGELVANQQALCDWRHWSERVGALVEKVKAGDCDAIAPFKCLSLPGLSAADHLRFMRAYAQRYQPWADAEPLWQTRPRTPQTRPRIGFISSDFYDHATARLTAAVFEHLDHDAFEYRAYAIGPARADPMRERLSRAFGGLIALHELDDDAAAARISDDGIDILIDLNGYAQQPRTGILARRPAPIQVAWLGFPATMGAPFIDYALVDEVVVPPQDAHYFAESLAYLPICYQPFDPSIAPAVQPTREALGLPAEAFVFCCFNNPFKLSPVLFDIWCQLLQEVPEAVLWLFAPGDVLRRNLSLNATERGVDARRLVFADYCSNAEHLARLGQADLFLDTWPYGAHTTARDALAAGVPVLTKCGDTFQSRVAASLLTAVDLPQLICASEQEYLQKALMLSQNPMQLQTLRMHLKNARKCSRLFDPIDFAAGLERIFKQMLDRRHRGLAPSEISL
ncbi:tetratricopeptide repeat protein [Lamprobacter modestohalophilus]|uniref:O-linked N-acetylglucosamine transferase family protein n=1 Tax=Lamprobacter modestohalophilus TaxID=1064514 RepID=UPI002ADECA3E|nr:tetratricopeptide repeat protein [Lamprobacter modestohalophilus]MEA1051511.1 tetratricopeptide repeat protein [Lamprobacter modestohalophilus]